jgi:hypothetical protein
MDARSRFAQHPSIASAPATTIHRKDDSGFNHAVQALTLNKLQDRM